MAKAKGPGGSPKKPKVSAGDAPKRKKPRSPSRVPDDAPRRPQPNKPGRDPSYLAPKERDEFLEQLSKGRGVRTTCTVLRVNYRRVKRTIEDDPDFAAEVQTRREMFWESMHEVARDLALQGDKDMLLELFATRRKERRLTIEMEQRRYEFNENQKARAEEARMRHQVALLALRGKYGGDEDDPALNAALGGTAIDASAGTSLAGTALEGKDRAELVAALSALDAILGPPRTS